MDVIDMEKRFVYHAPHDELQMKYETIRHTLHDMALLINATCPDSREKSLAITKLEEAMFWANASIARNE